MSKNNIIRNIVVDSVDNRDSKKRTMTFTISDESVNRYGQKVLVSGWDLKNFKKNGPLLVNHDSLSVDGVVGKSTRVWIDNQKKRLMGTFEFLPEGMSAKADLLWNLYDNDFMNSVSAGYIVNWEKATFRKNEKDPAVTFDGQELLECSLATIPANPNARKDMLKNAMDLGIINEEMIKKAGLDLEHDPVIEIKEPEVEKDVIVQDTPLVEKETNKLEEKTEQTIENTIDPYSWFYEIFDDVKKELNKDNLLSEQLINELKKDLQQKRTLDDVLSDLVK